MKEVKKLNSFYSEEELKIFGFSEIGTDVKISRKASIYGSQNMKIGDHVRIDDFCILSGRIVLGSYIHISAYTSIFAGDAGVFMENFVTVSSRSAIYAVSDDYSGLAMTNPTIPNEFRNVTSSKVVLERHTIVGTGSTILPGVTLHEGTSVGAMSLITKSTVAWKMYVGIPAKAIRDRKKDLLKLEKEIDM
ncbi:MAG: acyltransferase [Lachnospiraceae bacterium]|nr:acyltransferase [Lachnospiraceae bacterium]